MNRTRLVCFKRVLFSPVLAPAELFQINKPQSFPPFLSLSFTLSFIACFVIDIHSHTSLTLPLKTKTRIHPQHNISYVIRAIPDNFWPVHFFKINSWSLLANCAYVCSAPLSLIFALTPQPEAWKWAYNGETRGEREFPFPAFPGNTGLRFPFPKIGNDFSFPFPFPKVGNAFSIPVPVPKIWECNLPFLFPLIGMDYHVGNRMGMEFKSWDLEGSWLIK